MKNPANKKISDFKFKISKPTKTDIPSTSKWLKKQSIEVYDGEKIIAAIHVEVMLLTKKRCSITAFDIIDGWCQTEWETPFLHMAENQIGDHLLYYFSIPYKSMASVRHVLINQITVHPDYRRLGIASKLVGMVASIYKKAQSVWLKVCPLNRNPDDNDSKYIRAVCKAKNPKRKTLISFYDRLGFILNENPKTTKHPFMIGLPDKIIKRVKNI